MGLIMQPDPTKAKFDPIPVLPPGIAPPDPKPVPAPPAMETKPVPKPSEPAVTKPTAASASPAPAKTSSSTPAPSTPAPAAPSWLKGVFAPTKGKGIVAAATTSLFAGWYGVRTVFPPMSIPTEVAQKEPETPPLPELPTPTSSTEIPPVVPPEVAKPTEFMPLVNVPKVDLSTPVPAAATPVAASPTVPTATTPAVVPLVNLDNPATAAKPVPFAVPAVGNSEIKPASFDDPKPPAIPDVPPATPPAAAPAGGTPMPPINLPNVGAPDVPAAASGLPVVPGVTPPAAAEKPKDKPAEVPPPAIPAVDLPGLGAGLPPPSTPAPVASAPVVVPPPAIDLPPATAPTVPTAPPAATPAMTVPGVPSAATPGPIAPGGIALVSPDLNLSKPAASATPVPVVAAPVLTPPAASVTPVSPAPAPPVYTPPAAVTPTPTLLPVSGGSPAPAAPAVETKTDFDVDLHYPKQGETYATISKQHYGDERYAKVLEQFNITSGTTGKVVQVPPTWWVKKQSGTPTGRSAPAPVRAKGDEWSAAPSSSIREFEVPASKRDGMTFRDIATQVYGSDQEWQRVFDLNPQYAADAMIPAGAKVRVTATK